MEAEKQFNQIKEFLRRHQFLQEMEVLDRYGHAIPAMYTNWSQALKNLKVIDLINLQNSFEVLKIPDQELRTFIQQCAELGEINSLQFVVRDFHPFIKRKMSLKKVHEVQWFLGLFHNSSISQFFDIGSGMGHLSCALLSDASHRKSLCLDANFQYQLTGREKIKRWSPNLLERLEFRQAVVDENLILQQNKLRPSAILGLHGCGNLSVDVLRAFQRNELTAAVSFGCCYHKLDTAYNLSTMAKEHPLLLTNHALTLAAKSHSLQTEQSHQNKIRVKRYRYGLHFYCINTFGKSITSIGNTHKMDAELNFAAFLKKYLPSALASQVNEVDANNYIQSSDFQENFHFFIRLGIIRSFLGRLIEIYLLLDRVLWLREQGHPAKLVEAFNRKLSPRNLGIIAGNI